MGDFQVQIGQGLQLWTGFASGKSAEIMSIKKQGKSLGPYTSVDESRFLRGAGIELGFKQWRLLVFHSKKTLDANIETNEAGFEVATSINRSGFHRTESEMFKKGQLTETITGTQVQYDNNAFHLGISALNQSYDLPYFKPVLPYNLYDFRGASLNNIGIDYSYTFQNVSLFGETATSNFSNGLATINGALIALSPKLNMSLSHRSYSKSYHAFYAVPFAEGQKAQNEAGVFAGLQWYLPKSWSLKMYADQFTFPWLKYGVDGASEGHEYLVHLEKESVDIQNFTSGLENKIERKMIVLRGQI